MNVFNGGTADGTTVFVGGIDIFSGGRANCTTINDYGSMCILSGGVASATTLNPDGIGFNMLFVSRGGIASDTTLNGWRDYAKGLCAIHIEGIADNTIVSGGGSMYISSGGVHRGTLQIEFGTIVSASSGAKIDFTVARRTTEDDYLINNLSFISGSPTYTITVSAEQAAGTYKLAQGAADFTGSITIGDGTTDYGTLTVNGDVLEYNDRTYALKRVQGSLTLTIAGISEGPTSSDNASGVSWNHIPGWEYMVDFTVEYSRDGFATTLTVTTRGNAVDHYGMPEGTYQWRVNGNAGDDITATGISSPQLLASDADENLDLFFAVGKGTWNHWYSARHDGSLGGWTGTGEEVKLQGKNQLIDIFFGAAAASILVMTDDANGDALFLDDIFSDSPVLEQQARISMIKEIRAGAGDDLVDLTSQRFTSYNGEVVGGLTDRKSVV